MTPLVLLALGLVGALLAWRWSLRSAGSADRLTVAVLLGVMAAAFNVVVPVPNIEATTLVVVVLAMTLGPGAAVLAGAVGVLGTSVTGGVGVWTLWQVIGYAVVALVAAAFAAGTRSPGRGRILVAVAVATLCYDLLVTATSLPTLGIAAGEHWSDAMLAAVLLGTPFTLTHVAGSMLIAWFGAPALVRGLARARRRIEATAPAG